MDALHQPLARELLEVAVDGDRRHRMVARKLGHADPALPLDALEDLRPAECWGNGVQTGSLTKLRYRSATSSANAGSSTCASTSS